MYIQEYMQYYVSYGHLGEFLICDKTCHFCYQKDRTSSRRVSVHPYLSYDTLRTHRRGRGDKKESLTFLACHHKAYYTYYWNVNTKVYALLFVQHRGEFLVGNKTYQVCYQKDRTSSSSVSVHLYLSYDELCAHRRARGDKEENLTFFACHHEAYSTLRMVYVYASEFVWVILARTLGSPWWPATECETTT